MRLTNSQHGKVDFPNLLNFMLYNVHYDFIYKCFLEKMWRLAIILFQKSLVMRIKVSYKINGKETMEEGQINNFPRELWGIFTHFSLLRNFHDLFFHEVSVRFMQLTGITFWDQVVVCLVASHLPLVQNIPAWKSQSFSLFFGFEAKSICIMLNSIGANYFLWRCFGQCVSGYKCCM